MGGMRWTEDEYKAYLQRIEQAERQDVELNSETMIVVQKIREVALARVQAMQIKPEPPFKSKTERRAWNFWVPTTDCVEAYYESVRVYLNSGSYRPDFVLRMPDRELWFIEVKGSWNAYQSGRSSKKSLKEAAKLYWWLGRWFSLLPVKGGGWDLTEVK